MSSEVLEIQRVVVSVAHHIDRRCWDDLRALYADTVETDYTSLFGGSPQLQPADALIATWRRMLDGVTTQHLLGPIDVQLSAAARARATCHVRALHQAARAKSDGVWEVFGHYVFGLEPSGGSYRIASMLLETFHESGDRQLLRG